MVTIEIKMCQTQMKSFYYFFFYIKIFFLIYKNVLRLIKKTKKKVPENARERYLTKEEKQKSGNMGVNDIKTSLQIKTEGWLSIGKNIINH